MSPASSESIAGARESNKVAAITANAIKATGGAAKVTAGQVADLAASISKKTGLDDEAIQSGANLLLTFKNVRNEVGAGNDIFNQATAAAQDLAAAGFGSAEGAAKMLGKALNDPIKGMSALTALASPSPTPRRSKSRKWSRPGRPSALRRSSWPRSSPRSGAAEAAATAGDKARVAFGNLQETVGAKLLPVIDKGAGEVDRLRDRHAGRDWGRWKFAEVLGGVWSAGKDVVGFLDKYQDIIVPVAAGIGAIVIAQKAWTLATGLATTAQALFNAVLAANPIGLVVLALVGLAAGLVTAYKKSETFRDIVNGVWSTISDGASYMWNDVLKPTFKFIVEKFSASPTP